MVALLTTSCAGGNSSAPPADVKAAIKAACPAIKPYPPVLEEAALAEHQRLRAAGFPISWMLINDYGDLRSEARACGAK